MRHLAFLSAIFVLCACGNTDNTMSSSAGGGTNHFGGTPGAASGGKSAGVGGSASGGTSTLGAGGSLTSTGGLSNSATGGSSTGGSPAGGSATGGSATGGSGSTAICPNGPYAQSPLPSAEPTAQPVCQNLTFTEGPVWLAGEQALFFSNFESGNSAANFTGNIMRYVPGGACEAHVLAIGTNGLATNASGEILGASHLIQDIVRVNATSKQSTPLNLSYQGKHFSSPNDLAVHTNGTIYFSDPAWQVGNRTEELPQAAYRRDPAGNITVIEELSRPNGVTLSPDQSRLYISIPNAIRVYDLNSDGVPSNGRNFTTETGSDGMTVDCAGNLYTTATKVDIFSPDGQRLGSINSSNSTNVAFGGADRKTLFITGGTRLTSIQLNIPGFPY